MQHKKSSESLHDITPVETWSSKAKGTSVAAYFFYNIRASNFLGGPVTLQTYWPLRPVDTKVSCQCL